MSAKSVEQVIEIQTQYVKRAYDNFVAEVSKFSEWYSGVIQDASKPVAQPIKKKVA